MDVIFGNGHKKISGANTNVCGKFISTGNRTSTAITLTDRQTLTCHRCCIFLL